MIGKSIFAAALVVAFLDMAAALAQDDSAGKLPAVPHKPAVHHFASARVAAIQAPAPTPRPAAASSSSAKLTQTAASQNPAQVLQAFTVADLQAALADANAQNPPDMVAAACYQELINVVQSPAVNPLPTGPGAFQLFQKGRDLKNLVVAFQSRNGPLTQLNVACAPLVVDVQQTLIQLGIIGGAVAGTLIP